MLLDLYPKLEDSLAAVPKDVWKPKIGTVFENVSKHVNDGNPQAASNAMQHLDASNAMQEKRRRIEFLLRSGLMLGAHSVAPPAQNVFLSGQAPKLDFDKLTDTFIAMAHDSVKSVVTRQSGILIEKGVARVLDPSVLKSDVTPGGLVARAAETTTEALSDIAANAMTNRLVNFGALAQMRVRGSKHYQLEATLDQRTSNICRSMHGRTFTVEVAYEKLLQELQVVDPNDYRSIHPWIGGSQDVLRELDKMADSEMEASGWFLPPFHPRCRTVCVPQGTVEVSGEEYTPLSQIVQPSPTPDSPGNATAFRRWLRNWYTTPDGPANTAFLMRAFTQGLFRPVNQLLRYGTQLATEVASRAQEVLAMFDSLFSKTSIGSSIRVWRGLYDPASIGLNLSDPALVGTVVRDRGLISFTADRNLAALTGVSSPGEAVLAEVVLPEGTQAVAPGFFTRRFEDQELVLRGGRFRILGVDVENTTIGPPENATLITMRIVRMELLPGSGKSEVAAADGSSSSTSRFAWRSGEIAVEGA